MKMKKEELLAVLMGSAIFMASIMAGCAQKTAYIPPPKVEITAEQATEAVNQALEDINIIKGAMEREKDNSVVGVDITMQEAEIAQAEALIRAGQYKRAMKIAKKAQEDAYRLKNELLAKIITRKDSEVTLLPGQPGYAGESPGSLDPSMKVGALEYTVGTWEENRDCLWNIANYMYSDPWAWKKIYKANSHQISDPDVIHTGQILIIPAVN